MKIGILLFEQFYGKENIGSSRIRGHWIAKHWKAKNIIEVINDPELGYDVANSDCETFRMGGKYDVIIYQKVYWIEHARDFKGIKILDMCDPDFLHWGYRVKEMVDLCDAVTTSGPELAEFMAKYTDKPVVCVPDRMDLEAFGGLKKVHSGVAKVAAWFGYSENFAMLDAAITALIKNKFDELIVIANQRSPYQLPAAARGKILVTNIPWAQNTVNNDLLKADLVVNPQTTTGKWKYKSNNKTVTAWALGLPVAHTAAEMMEFMTAEARQREGDRRYTEVREKYDVRQSVVEMKELIQRLSKNKNDAEGSMVNS